MRLDRLNKSISKKPTMDDVFSRYARLPEIPITIWLEIFKCLNLMTYVAGPVLLVFAIPFYCICYPLRFFLRKVSYCIIHISVRASNTAFSANFYSIAKGVYNLTLDPIFRLKLIIRTKLATNNVSRVFDAAKMLLKNDPKNYKASLFLAHAAVWAEKENQAINLLASADDSFSVALAAVLLNNLGENERVMELLLNFSQKEPEFAETIGDYLSLRLSNRSAAVAAYARAIDLKPTKALLLKQALALPPVEPNGEMVLGDIRRAIEYLLINPVPEDDSTYLDSFSGLFTFYRHNTNLIYLPYLGANSLDILENTAKVYNKFFPVPGEFSPRPQVKSKLKPHRIKFGFFAEFCNEHTADFWAPFLNSLPRDIYEVVLFAPKHLKINRGASTLFSVSDKIVEFPYYVKNVPMIDVSKVYAEKALPITREIVSAESLDIFHIPFVSYDIISQYLAFSRLAPVQLTDGANLNTSGLPYIDYYLMNSYGFTGEPDQWFSEKLVFLRGADEKFAKHLIPVEPEQPFYKRSDIKRSDFGLPADRPFYLCIQDLARRHVETDDLFVRLLTQDKDAFLAISGNENLSSRGLFMSFKRNMKSLGLNNVEDRVFLAPSFLSKSRNDYLAFLKLADAHLIYRRFPGGQSFLDFLELDLPAVSWLTEKYNNYIPLYGLLGLDELMSVKNSDDYIKLALRLAHDKKWSTDLRCRLKSAKARYLRYSEKHDFFRHDLSLFLQMALERAKSGLPPAHWRGGQFYDHLTAAQLKDFIHNERELVLKEE